MLGGGGSGGWMVAVTSSTLPPGEIVVSEIPILEMREEGDR